MNRLMLNDKQRLWIALLFPGKPTDNRRFGDPICSLPAQVVPSKIYPRIFATGIRCMYDLQDGKCAVHQEGLLPPQGDAYLKELFVDATIVRGQFRESQTKTGAEAPVFGLTDRSQIRTRG